MGGWVGRWGAQVSFFKDAYSHATTATRAGQLIQDADSLALCAPSCDRATTVGSAQGIGRLATHHPIRPMLSGLCLCKGEAKIGPDQSGPPILNMGD